MKKVLLQVIILLSPLIACAQATSSDYQTAINRFERYYNHEQADSLFNMFAPVMQTAAPIDKTRALITQLKSSMGDIQEVQLLQIATQAAAYKVTFDKIVRTMTLSLNSDGLIQGFFFRPYEDKKNEESAHTTEQSNIQLKTKVGTIYGTLTEPHSDGKVPVVLIIAGSGPTDRDGNSPLGVKANSYKMLADSLQAAGIACARYDKRHIGESKVNENESDVRFGDMISDAEGFIKILKKDPRFSKVIVLGHSEGSLIGMVAAREAKADAYISLAGAGKPANEILARQLKAQHSAYTDLELRDLDSLKKGMSVKYVPQPLMTLFRPSVQPYLVSWFKYDPQQEIKKLKIPVLILQGTTDLQVTVNDAKELKKANPKATLKIITGMNHPLKNAPADRAENIATYSNPDLPLNKELVATIRHFIKHS